MNDFEKFATSKHISTNTLSAYASAISPTIIEERRLNAVGMDVFSRLMLDRIIFLGTDIDADVANIVTSQLLYLNTIDSTQPIKLFINSPGGSIIDGLAIYDMMNYVSANVNTYVIGLAASMACVLLSSGSNRHAFPNSKVLIHQPMSGASPGTQESDFAIEYEELKKYKKTIYNILSENTGKSYKKIAKDSDRDCWFTAQEALSYGLIDKIITKQ